MRIRSFSLLNRIMLFIMAFIVTLLLQIYISQYQTQYVILPQQERMSNIQSISRFLNDVEGCMQALEKYRWDYGDSEEMTRSVSGYQADASMLVGLIQGQIGQVSEEYYLLANASKTTYSTFSATIDEILTLLEKGNNHEAASLYYDKAEPCGSYTRQYTQQLLEEAIQDSRSTFSELTALGNTLQRIQTLTVVACIFLGIMAFSTLFTLLRLVRQMAATSYAISQGDLDVSDVETNLQDEVGRMVRAFNEMKASMKCQVHALEERNQMEQRLLKKENEALELQNLMEREKLQQLRSQINPHFLFNTLNVILYTSRKEGAQQTGELITSLSTLFRYVLGSNEALVPLSREIRIVDEFYKLNKARFAERIALYWYIHPEVDATEVLVPSFILQPLVENAFKHGLGPKENGGRVEIHISQDPKFLMIAVLDDGVGMEPESLAHLKQNLRNPPTTGEHIGIYNVAARMRLRGDGGLLEVQSQKDMGTTVLLQIPLHSQSEEENDDSYTDC